MSFHKLSALLFFFMLIGASPASWPKEISSDPIDVQYEKAMDKDPSTMGMRSAANDARAKWDKDMNKSYANLMAGLNNEKKNALRMSQRSWLTFRDAETESNAKIIASQDGTLWQLTATIHQMDVVRSRALQLREYESALAEQKAAP
jgi:uncharacterized protein YecT (DUF1311 family)